MAGTEAEAVGETVTGVEVGAGVEGGVGNGAGVGGNGAGVVGVGSGDGTGNVEEAGTVAGRSVDVSGERGVGSLCVVEEEGARTEGGPVTAPPD